MPDSHLALWRYLYVTLPNQVITAGSFASVQMRHNLTGEETDYNDIDYWYDENEDSFLTSGNLTTIIGMFTPLLYVFI